MKEKIIHHPILAGLTLAGLLYVATIITAVLLHPLWWLLSSVALFVYVGTFILDARYVLVCPNCGYSPWSKENYFCAHCGIKLIFTRKQKVKPKEKVKPGRIPLPTCSKGHSVWAFDKYCPKCGEKL